jgi:phosphoserine phosphatase
LRLCVFDFDSTLMDGETIDILASLAGCEAEVSKITEAAMAGELDFFESLTRRVTFLKGVDAAKAKARCAELPFIEGAKDIISALKAKDYKVIVFSGGFSIGTAPARAKLGFDMDFSNKLHEKDGILTGLVGGEMMYSDSKGVMLSKLQSILGISVENTIAVGDGANDASMFEFAAKKIAFCAKPKLKEKANIIIDTKDLREIEKYI